MRELWMQILLIEELAVSKRTDFLRIHSNVNKNTLHLDAQKQKMQLELQNQLGKPNRYPKPENRYDL